MFPAHIIILVVGHFLLLKLLHLSIERCDVSFLFPGLVLLFLDAGSEAADFGLKTFDLFSPAIDLVGAFFEPASRKSKYGKHGYADCYIESECGVHRSFSTSS